MSRRRTVAVLVAAAAAFLVAPHALPAQAATHHDRAAAPAPATAHPLIQGVVVDQNGKPVDDVSVEAVKPDGTVQASALTYASNRPGGPQHGYFYLEVTKGTYTLALSRSEYEDGQPVHAVGLIILAPGRKLHAIPRAWPKRGFRGPGVLIPTR